MIDTLIIGKGPAGISCSLYLKRYGFNPVVVGIDGGNLAKAHLIENYYGIESISGKDLIETGIKQAQRLGVEVITDEIINIEYLGNSVLVEGKEKTYEAKTLVIATGNQVGTLPMFEGFDNVSYCAICDGFFYRKKRIAVIGNTKYMLHEASVLEKMVGSMTVFTNSLPLQESSNYEVITDKIIKIIPNDNNPNKASKIVTTNGEYEVDGIFVAMGNLGSFQIAKHLGIELVNNKIKVNDDFKTNIDRIYACGDTIGGLLQVSKAVCDGAICATSINKYLKQLGN